MADKLSTTCPPSPRAAATRQRILDAALAEFAEKGLAGARIDDIAARGGVNKRMIYAYFGNKEDLWLTTLERAYAAKRDEESALKVADLPPRDAMARLVSFNLRYTAAHPEFVALLNQENLHRGAYLSRSDKVEALYTPLLDLIRDVLGTRGRRGGFSGRRRSHAIVCDHRRRRALLRREPLHVVGDFRRRTDDPGGAGRAGGALYRGRVELSAPLTPPRV